MCAARSLCWPALLLLPGVLGLAVLQPAPAAAAGLGIQSAPTRPGLDRSIRKINLSAYVTRRLGLAPICVPPKRVTGMNIRYGDLDGDNAEEAVMEAVTCKSPDGLADVIGVFTYEHPDSLRELRTEHATVSDDPVFKGLVGPLRLELIDGRLVRWFAIEGEPCGAGTTRARGRRAIVYRWSGDAFVVDRLEERAPRC